MSKYQIVEVTEKLNHAGTKATDDFSAIAESTGFDRVEIRKVSSTKGVIGKLERQIQYLIDWNLAFKQIADNSVVLLQHPFHYKQLTREMTLRKLKKQKKVKYISVVHDVEELRQFRYNNYYAHEFESMIELADVLIVHNDVMKDWFISKGVPSNKLISLGIFDYIQVDVKDKAITYANSISIAGNLDTVKCGYIGKLGELKNLSINLYGPNFDDRLKHYPNIYYKGSYPVDDIPKLLNSGFGLVWDGDSLEGCKGLSGQYLKYNNPHKLSLYLSSGLPVIIWKQAAEAKLVEENNVGIAINSLYDIESVLNNISHDEFDEMVKNVNRIRAALCKGEYGRKSLELALKMLESC